LKLEPDLDPEPEKPVVTLSKKRFFIAHTESLMVDFNSSLI